MNNQFPLTYDLFQIYQPGWRTRSPQDSLPPVCQGHPPANEKGKSSRKRVYCSQLLITERKKNSIKKDMDPEHRTIEKPSFLRLTTRLLAL